MAQQCTATNRQGAQCGQFAAPGAKICRFHGARSPGAAAKAAERVTEANARRELAKLGALLGPAEMVENPLERLQQLAGEADRWMDLMRRRVAELTAVGYESALGQEQVKAEVQLYERAMDRTAQILSAIARLNIDERLAAVSERQADTVLRALNGVLDWLGLDHEHKIQAKRIAAARLRDEKAPLPPSPDLYRVVQVAAPPRLERRAIEAPPPARPFLGAGLPAEPRTPAPAEQPMVADAEDATGDQGVPSVDAPPPRLSSLGQQLLRTGHPGLRGGR